MKSKTCSLIHCVDFKYQQTLIKRYFDQSFYLVKKSTLRPKSKAKIRQKTRMTVLP